MGGREQKAEKERANGRVSRMTRVCVASECQTHLHARVHAHTTQYTSHESEPHRQSLEVGVSVPVYSSSAVLDAVGRGTTAFAFFGEVKAVSGKFWLDGRSFVHLIVLHRRIGGRNVSFASVSRVFQVCACCVQIRDRTIFGFPLFLLLAKHAARYEIIAIAVISS